MASGTDEKVKYVCMELTRWEDHDDPYPPASFAGSRSIGYYEVFYDVEKLKEAYPDADIMQITRMRD